MSYFKICSILFFCLLQTSLFSQKININSRPINIYFFTGNNDLDVEGFIVTGHSNHVVCSAVSALLMVKTSELTSNHYAKDLPFVSAGVGKYFIPDYIIGYNRSKMVTTLNSLQQKAKQIEEDYPSYINIFTYSREEYFNVVSDFQNLLTKQTETDYPFVIDYELDKFPIIVPYYKLDGENNQLIPLKASISSDKLPSEKSISYIEAFKDNIAQQQHNLKVVNQSLYGSTAVGRKWSLTRVPNNDDGNLEKSVSNFCSNENIPDEVIENIVNSDNNFTLLESLILTYQEYKGMIDLINAFTNDSEKRITIIDFEEYIEYLNDVFICENSNTVGCYNAYSFFENQLYLINANYKKVKDNIDISKIDKLTYNHLTNSSTYDSFLRGWFLEYGSSNKNEIYDDKILKDRKNIVPLLLRQYDISYNIKQQKETELIDIKESEAELFKMALFKVSGDNLKMKYWLRMVDSDKFNRYNEFYNNDKYQSAYQLKKEFPTLRKYMEQLSISDYPYDDLMIDKLGSERDDYSFFDVLQIYNSLKFHSKSFNKKSKEEQIEISRMILRYHIIEKNYEAHKNIINPFLSDMQYEFFRENVNFNQYYEAFLMLNLNSSQREIVDNYVSQLSIGTDYFRFPKENYQQNFDFYINGVDSYLNVPYLQNQQVVFSHSQENGKITFTLNAVLSGNVNIIYNPARKMFIYNN